MAQSAVVPRLMPLFTEPGEIYRPESGGHRIPHSVRNCILATEMERTLLEHISDLERKIETLKNRLKEAGRTQEERNQAMIDLGIAERSLVYYRKAFDLEQEISD